MCLNISCLSTICAFTQHTHTYTLIYAGVHFKFNFRSIDPNAKMKKKQHWHETFAPFIAHNLPFRFNIHKVHLTNSKHRIKMVVFVVVVVIVLGNIQFDLHGFLIPLEMIKNLIYIP